MTPIFKNAKATFHDTGEHIQHLHNSRSCWYWLCWRNHMDHNIMINLRSKDVAQWHSTLPWSHNNLSMKMYGFTITNCKNICSSCYQWWKDKSETLVNCADYLKPIMKCIIELQDLKDVQDYAKEICKDDDNISGEAMSHILWFIPNHITDSCRVGFRKRPYT